MIFEMIQEAGKYLVKGQLRYGYEYEVSFDNSALAFEFIKSLTQEVD